MEPSAGQAGRKAKHQVLIEVSKEGVDTIISQLLSDYNEDDDVRDETTASDIFNLVSNEESGSE